MPAMTKEQKEKSKNIIKELLKKHESIRHFAKVLNEDPADIARWKDGITKVRVSGIVSMAKIFNVKPYDLRPDWFPKDIEFVFKKRGE